jgi:hypothetical protein
MIHSEGKWLYNEEMGMRVISLNGKQSIEVKFQAVSTLDPNVLNKRQAEWNEEQIRAGLLIRKH